MTAYHLTLIEVTVDGRRQYVAANSCLCVSSTVDNPLHAIDYTDRPDDLEQAIRNIVTPFDEVIAKSGVRSETLPVVVTIEVTFNEVNRVAGRGPHVSSRRGD
jgi:hypothetical protein